MLRLESKYNKMYIILGETVYYSILLMYITYCLIFSGMKCMAMYITYNGDKYIKCLFY